MYTIASYGKMIASSIRTNAYIEALCRLIRPDSVVVDIGTGTGFFAVLASQLGARLVYAIEPDDAIQVAREMAAVNECGERIVFIQERSTRVTLSEQADVIISDLRGVLPLFQHHIASIVDARQRLLAPGGVLIPQQDTLWASIVEAPDLYGDLIGLYDTNRYGLDMRAARAIVTNTWRKGRVDRDQLLAEPQCWATLDYRTIKDPNINAEVTWTVARAGTGHGISVWFDATLVEGVNFSNAPGEPELIYGIAFFPWSIPVTLAVGDTVSISIRADLIRDDYVWSWHTRVFEQNRSDLLKASFNQSTFSGAPLSLSRLQKCRAAYTPTLSEDGQIDQFILSLIDGQTSLDEIARQVVENFPDRFTTWQDALTRVGELSIKYSR